MKDEISEKLDDLEEYTSFLKEYKDENPENVEEDMKLRGALERYLQLSIEIVIEVCEMIISKEGYDKPSSYREVIEILGKEGILPKKFSEKLAPAAGLRNILVHKYKDLKTEEMMSLLQESLDDFTEFSRIIIAYLL